MYDSQTKLTRFGARDYDASIGRWLLKEPKGFTSGQTDFYSYANSDPLNFVDHNGEDAIRIIYEGYMVDTGQKIFGNEIYLPLGHSAVIAVEPKTGYTKYYEYGRYGGKFGKVMSRKVPNLVMCGGKPTEESLKNLYDYISKNYGKGNPVNSQYYSDADYNKVVKYAEGIRSNPNRAPYNILLNNCYTFSYASIISGQKK